MGCYTRFDLDIYLNGEPGPDVVDALLCAIPGLPYYVDIPENAGDVDPDARVLRYTSEEPGTWYNYGKDMSTVAAQFPRALFRLRGEGEEAGDIWAHAFKGGQDQRQDAVVTIPPFSPDLSAPTDDENKETP